MPVRVVVQLVSPAFIDTELVAVAVTASTSGATTSSASASASPIVRVDAVPKPPRMPESSVELPGDTTRTLVPSSSIWSWTSARAPRPMPTVRITAVIPIRIPSIVRADRRRWVRTASAAVKRVSRQFMPRPRLSVRRPSLMCTTRPARVATSDSWVISTIVRPLSCRSPRRSSTSDVEAESRLPVGSSARSRSGSVTSARAIATRCCWPPESSIGRWSARSASPTRSSAARARCRRTVGSTPA